MVSKDNILVIFLRLLCSTWEIQIRHQKTIFGASLFISFYLLLMVFSFIFCVDIFLNNIRNVCCDLQQKQEIFVNVQRQKTKKEKIVEKDR